MAEIIAWLNIEGIAVLLLAIIFLLTVGFLKARGYSSQFSGNICVRVENRRMDGTRIVLNSFSRTAREDAIHVVSSID